MDLTLTGHHHSYQRTCAVAGSACVAPCADGSTPAPVHVVTGNGGAALSATRPLRPPLFAAVALRHGYARVDADRRELRLTAVRSSNGAVLDTFVLRKAPASPVATCAPHPVWWWPASAAVSQAGAAAAAGLALAGGLACAFARLAAALLRRRRSRLAALSGEVPSAAPTSDGAAVLGASDTPADDAEARLLADDEAEAAHS